MQLFVADWIHHEGTFHAGLALLADDAGRIVRIAPASELRGSPEAAGAEVHELSGYAIAPGTISAHSHAFQVFLRGAGDHPEGFRDWVKHHLYPLVERLDDTSLEAAALLCFAQMARAGITTVGEFHYIHNRAGDYAPHSQALSDIVIRAARRVGLRIAFCRAIYDVQERFGQGRFAEPYPESIAHIRELHARYQGDPFVTILPAPHSIHGATKEAVQAGAELARELDTRWHIHLAEQRSDVAYSQHLHQAAPLRVLDQLGILDQRTVIVHGIWLGEDERDLLAERGGALVSNPITNMALGDGIAPLADFLRRGVKVGLGTDMNASPDVFAEMRTAELLQRVQAHRMGMLSRLEGRPDPQRIFELGTASAGEALGLETGKLAAGQWADFLVIELNDASLLPASFVGGHALVSALFTSMVPETAIRDVYVAARPIVRDHRLLGIGAEELAERVKQASVVASGARPS